MKPAHIVWREDGVPESQEFGDIYFSKAGGLEETRHVFLSHNDLPQRFARTHSFTIAETGFGTGLNFLAAWQAFAQHAPQDAVLHYLSVEKHPLLAHDLKRAHSLWPELCDYAQALQAIYPAPAPGVHRLLLAEGRVRLTLLFGDAKDMLPSLTFRANAWFLDGFAPAANPHMWEEALLERLPAHSAPDATFATFTSAGHVRRSLEKAGFAVEKVKGYGHKREMLRGKLGASSAPAHCAPPSHALVIGAGAAGAACAYGLALRGTSVTIIDRHAAPALGTSANQAAILFPFSSRAWMKQTSFYLAGLQFTRQQITQLRRAGHRIAGAFCGMVQCPKPSQEEARLLEIPALLELDESIVKRCDAEVASRLCGLPLTSGALYWPQSGWFSLADYTRACLSHPLITFVGERTITRLHRQEEKWTAVAGDMEIASGRVAILANAADALALLPPPTLPIRTVGGQVTHLRASPATEKLSSVLCYGGYLTPAWEGRHHLGATYEHHRTNREIDEDSHRANLSLAKNALHHLPQETDITGGWADFRATTPDKLPFVGETAMPGLYVSLAHGSRAALSCPLAGEIIASSIHNEPTPLVHSLSQALSPARF